MKIGKKHVELFGRWLPHMMTYGAASGVALFYFTEWRAVLQYVPYINWKYIDEQD